MNIRIFLRPNCPHISKSGHLHVLTVGGVETQLLSEGGLHFFTISSQSPLHREIRRYVQRATVLEHIKDPIQAVRLIAGFYRHGQFEADVTGYGHKQVLASAPTVQLLKARVRMLLAGQCKPLTYSPKSRSLKPQPMAAVA